MASSFSSTKSNASASPYKDVQGYIHDVSNIKTPANPKSSRYFDFKIQEADDETRVVCFNADCQGEVKDKEQCKRPCLLTNVSPQKRRFAEGMEYKMNKYSRVTIVKNLAFQWKEGADLSETTVKDILESKATGDIVTLKAQVLSKSDVQTVYSRNLRKDLKKCEVVIADTSGAISVTIWEDLIEDIKPQSSYHFQQLKVSFFDRKYLNANKDTKINMCDEHFDLSPDTIKIADDLKANEKVDESITGSILAVDVNRSYTCIN